jgi:hypothetical protein
MYAKIRELILAKNKEEETKCVIDLENFRDGFFAGINPSQPFAYEQRKYLWECELKMTIARCLDIDGLHSQIMSIHLRHLTSMFALDLLDADIKFEKEFDASKIEYKRSGCSIS